MYSARVIVIYKFCPARRALSHYRVHLIPASRANIVDLVGPGQFRIKVVPAFYAFFCVQFIQRTTFRVSSHIHCDWVIPAWARVLVACILVTLPSKQQVYNSHCFTFSYSRALTRRSQQIQDYFRRHHEEYEPYYRLNLASAQRFLHQVSPQQGAED